MKYNKKKRDDYLELSLEVVRKIILSIFTQDESPHI